MEQSYDDYLRQRCFFSKNIWQKGVGALYLISTHIYVREKVSFFSHYAVNVFVYQVSTFSGLQVKLECIS
jgi:hypothetical protein